MKFIDFCAGIGGGHLGLEQIRMSCIGFSDIIQKKHFYKIENRI
jgi:site-specific DNA-cytosine methylase